MVGQDAANPQGLNGSGLRRIVELGVSRAGLCRLTKFRARMHSKRGQF